MRNAVWRMLRFFQILWPTIVRGVSPELLFDFKRGIAMGFSNSAWFWLRWSSDKVHDCKGLLCWPNSWLEPGRLRQCQWSEFRFPPDYSWIQEENQSCYLVSVCCGMGTGLFTSTVFWKCASWHVEHYLQNWGTLNLHSVSFLSL